MRMHSSAPYIINNVFKHYTSRIAGQVHRRAVNVKFNAHFANLLILRTSGQADF